VLFTAVKFEILERAISPTTEFSTLAEQLLRLMTAARDAYGNGKGGGEPSGRSLAGGGAGAVVPRPPAFAADR
jgi:hypothetical protein